MTTSTSPFTTDASARLPGTDVWFALPAGFTPLPMRELLASESTSCTPDPGAIVASLLAAVDDPAEQHRLVTVLAPLRRLIHSMAQTGVIHCSVGLHTDDEGDGGLLPSLFTLAWRKMPWAPRSIMAARTAASAENAVRVDTLELPCGPASLVEALVKAPPGSGLGQQLLQISAYVPYPDGERLAILTLATPAVERADHYHALLHEIACLVSFDNPLSPESDEE